MPAGDPFSMPVRMVRAVWCAITADCLASKAVSAVALTGPAVGFSSNALGINVVSWPRFSGHGLGFFQYDTQLVGWRVRNSLLHRGNRTLGMRPLV
jgi:hypothetical protein